MKVEDTCPCGDKFVCTNRMPNLFPKDTETAYSIWLEAHKVCREKALIYKKEKPIGGRRKVDLE